MEYEGVHLICFQCGKYGHKKDSCSHLVTSQTADVVATESGSNAASGPVEKTPDWEGDLDFDPWMVVTRNDWRSRPRNTTSQPVNRHRQQNSDSRRTHSPTPHPGGTMVVAT